jgi:hypothetical protein
MAALLRVLDGVVVITANASHLLAGPAQCFKNRATTY